MRAKVRAGFWLLLCCWQFGALSAQSYVGVSDTLVVKDSVSAAACCLQQQELPFWFSARGSVDWQPEGEEAVRFTMFYAVAKDSLLYVHLSKFGIELARALFRPDSVFLLLSATGNYWTGTYAVLGRKVGYPVDFSLLQGLLTAMPDAPYVQTDSNGLLRTAQWGPSESVSLLTMCYSRHETVGGDSLSMVFPMEAEAVFPEAGQRLQWQLKQVRLGVPGPSSFSIPKKYTPLKW